MFLKIAGQRRLNSGSICRTVHPNQPLKFTIYGGPSPFARPRPAPERPAGTTPPPEHRERRPAERSSGQGGRVSAPEQHTHRPGGTRPPGTAHGGGSLSPSPAGGPALPRHPCLGCGRLGHIGRHPSLPQRAERMARAPASRRPPGHAPARRRTADRPPGPPSRAPRGSARSARGEPSLAEPAIQLAPAPRAHRQQAQSSCRPCHEGSWPDRRRPAARRPPGRRAGLLELVGIGGGIGPARGRPAPSPLTGRRPGGLAFGLLDRTVSIARLRERGEPHSFADLCARSPWQSRGAPSGTGRAFSLPCPSWSPS